MTTDQDGAKAFLLGRIHPVIWVSCLGYVAPVIGSMWMTSGGGADNARIFRLAFLSAAFLLVGGAFAALWRMHVQKRAHPAGPHYAGRLVAVINIAMGLGALVLFIAVPAGHSPMYANENAAVSTLRSLVAAQEQFRLQARVDLDGDEQGEYGTLGELAGTDPLRGSGRTMSQAPFIATILGMRMKDSSFAKKSGYYFALYLPSHTSGTTTHPPGSGSAPAVNADADLQERHWVAYAWPVKYDDTGRRAFAVAYDGLVRACRNEAGRYDGLSRAPAGDALFPAANGPTNVMATLPDHAANTPDAAPNGRDGQVWYTQD